MTANAYTCSFCNKTSDRVIAGPTVYICFSCATAYSEVLKQAPASTAVRKDASPPCSFCGQDEAAARRVFAGANGSICSGCLGLSNAIMGKP